MASQNREDCRTGIYPMDIRLSSFEASGKYQNHENTQHKGGTMAKDITNQVFGRDFRTKPKKLTHYLTSFESTGPFRRKLPKPTANPTIGDPFPGGFDLPKIKKTKALQIEAKERERDNSYRIKLKDPNKKEAIPGGVLP